eukprot:GHVO01010286.1.p1 GENE.GHVO01010286.1~~GHVO01010286.1.p1  ORF type:complete len:282 (+),score=27.94 GHVO01010286.1:3-848(+)
MLFLLYVGTAPILDVLYSSAIWPVRLHSSFVCFSTIRDSRILFVLDSWALETALLSMAAIRPLIGLLVSFYPIQSAFLNRRYLMYARSVGPIERGGAETRADEAGMISASNLLMYLIVGRTYPPLAYHELVIGPEIIKGVRLSDILTVQAWHGLALSSLMRFISLLLLPNWINFGIFGLHLLLGFFDNIIAQSIRVLTLRRFELKALMEDIITLNIDAIKTDELAETLGIQSEPEEREDESENEDGWRTLHRRKFVHVSDVSEYYKRHGFYTGRPCAFPML